MHTLLQETAHRTIPLPHRPWIMHQNWHDLLFAHWAMPPEQIRPVVPDELELDLRDGQAYVAVVPFWMSGVRGRYMPPLPTLHTFPELNVRTYVRYKGVPGVYFFSLDAASRTAVAGARASFHLPYFHASMAIKSQDERFTYASRRLDSRFTGTHGNVPLPAEFRGRYWPVTAPRQREHGSLESFLTDRYCLYTAHHGKVLRADIHHPPWPLQDAAGEIETNTMAQAAGIVLPNSKPLLHFSRSLQVLIWWPEEA